MKLRLSLIYKLPLVLVCLAAAPAAAQTASRAGEELAVSGTVRDGSGAAIPRATVVIQHESSGFQQVVDAVSDGFVDDPQAP